MMTGLPEANDLFESGALERMKDSEPSVWLAAPPELLHGAKEVSELLFSVAATYSVKSQLKKLLTDRFDAEQIWQQIDLQARPLLSNLRRRLMQLEKSGETFFISNDDQSRQVRVNEMGINGGIEAKGGNGGLNGVSHEGDLSGSEGEEPDLIDDKNEDSSMDGVEESSEGGQVPAEEGSKGKRPVEDSFLKLNEMERFLDLADAEDAGVEPPFSDNKQNKVSGSQEEDEEDEEEDKVDDALNYSANMKDNHLGTETEQFRYEDFFGKSRKKNCDAILKNTLDLMPDEGEETDDDVEESDGIQVHIEKSLAQVPKQSAHERKLEKIRTQVEQLEKENLEQKQWTLQGEVTAAKRPKNSALEVELDFEHNARPPPVITDEVTTNLEDIIKQRISEEQFDDVERKSRFPVPSPSARIEIDENKSQKGLADVYEGEYLQKSGLVAPTSSSEKLKEEATMLFKSLCVRLDSLSHFHFAPKPVVEDMTIRADVPALAMEEVAPLAISDASMLAPEEVFAGKGLLKDEKELTQNERKRRRARKKHRYKEHQRKELTKKVRTTDIASKKPLARRTLNKDERSGHFSYVKSAKVFAELDKIKAHAIKSLDKGDKKLHPSFLKL